MFFFGQGSPGVGLPGQPGPKGEQGDRVSIPNERSFVCVFVCVFALTILRSLKEEHRSCKITELNW